LWTGAVKVTWLRIGALVINLLLVVYLVWSKRLFGVRGGKRAYEARLRSESVIEVEQAALVGSSPAEGGPADRNEHAAATVHHGSAASAPAAAARPPAAAGAPAPTAAPAVTRARTGSRISW
jgi:hypothetical protein